MPSRSLQAILDDIAVPPELEDAAVVERRPSPGTTLKRKEGPDEFVQQYCTQRIREGAQVQRGQVNTALVTWADELHG